MKLACLRVQLVGLFMLSGE